MHKSWVCHINFISSSFNRILELFIVNTPELFESLLIIKPETLFELDIKPPSSVYIITGPLELLNNEELPNEVSEHIHQILLPPL